MATKTRLLLAGAAALALSTAARADDIPIYEHVGNWDVRVDTSVGQNACFIQGSWNPGSVVLRAGLYSGTGGYIAAASPLWSSLQPDQTYPVQLWFNGGSPQTFNATAKTFSNGSTFLLIRFNSADGGFWRDMATAQALHITYQGHAVFSGNLPGSAAAIASMFRCRAAYTPNPDPFTPVPFTPAAPARPADPFKTF
jgi:hypothetical protein